MAIRLTGASNRHATRPVPALMRVSTADEVRLAVVGIQLLLADTGDATTGETVTSWPGSDGPPRQ